jgi:hypothetical protein
MPDETQYKRGDRHVYRHVGGEHLLVAIHRDTIAPLFSLTPTAGAIWQALAEWTTIEQIADSLTRSFDVGAEDAARDVSEFLDQLRQVGALLVRDRRTDA